MESDFSKKLLTACSEGNVEAVKELLDKEAYVDDYFFQESSPLCVAIRSGNETIVKMLLERGCKINCEQKPYNCSSCPFILNTAVEYGNVKICECLIDAGAKIDHENIEGESSIFVAVELVKLDMVNFFIKKGIDVNEYDRKGKIPLHHAAAQYGPLEIVKTLLDAGSDINYEDVYDKTPLFYAVEYDNIAVVECFIEKGINVNAHDNDGKIPLHYAAGNGHLEIVRILLEAGSELEREDYTGRTPFFSAASNHCTVYGVRDNADVLNLLLERGARMNIKDKFGYTPLLRAIRYVCYENVRYLLNAGSYINIKTWDKHYALFHRDFRGSIELKKTKSILKKYVKKLLAANIDASMVIRIFELDGIEYEPFEESCIIEVEKMKIRTFWGASLFDVLIKPENPTFADNLMLEQFIKSDSIKEEFRNYAVLLKSKFTEAKNRNNLLNNAISKVKLDLQETGVHLPNEIKRKILCYLNNEELDILIKAF